MSSNQVNQTIGKTVRLSFCGLQEHPLTGMCIPLWNCLESTQDGLTKNSTVSAVTLLRLGYNPPSPYGKKVGDIVISFNKKEKFL